MALNASGRCETRGSSGVAATVGHVLGTESFPLADIPMRQMIAKAEAGRYKAKPVRVFGFDEIVRAHQAMEEGLAAGKMVVAVN